MQQSQHLVMSELCFRDLACLSDTTPLQEGRTKSFECETKALAAWRTSRVPGLPHQRRDLERGSYRSP